MAPGKDTHGTPMPEREGRVGGRSTQPEDRVKLSLTTYMEAQLRPVQFSSVRTQQQTGQVVKRRQEVDGQFVGSRKPPRQRTQGDDTPDLRDQSQKRGVDQQSPE